MRTTVDLDESLLRRLREEAYRHNISFRALLHRLIQRGLDESAEPPEAPYEAPSLALGAVRDGVDLVHALRTAAALEDEEVVRELARRR